MSITNKNLGNQTKTCVNNLASINAQLQAWQLANSQSNMTQLSSVSTETIFGLYEQSQTNVNYLLIYMMASSIGKAPTGAPAGSTFVTPTSVATVSYQAWAILNLTVSLTQEIETYCQQYISASAQVDNGCSCPTVEQCTEVIQQWESASLVVSIYTSYNLTNTTLIRFMNATSSGTFMSAVTSTNQLLAQQKTCANCMTTGCQKNKAKAVKQCSGGKSKNTCKRKASKSAKRVKSNISRGKKHKKEKKQRGQKSMEKNVNNRWSNVWGFGNRMMSNFYANVTATTATGKFLVSNNLVRNDMMSYYYLYSNYTFDISQSSNVITEAANICSNETNAAVEKMVADATNTYFDQVYAFSQKVTDDNNTKCYQASDKAFELLAAFANEIEKCPQQAEVIVQQIYLNISTNFYYWGQRVDYWSSGHDQCVRSYCPFLSLLILSPWTCMSLKRALPSIYDTPQSISKYRSCNQQVRIFFGPD